MDVNPWLKWKTNLILALFLPKSSKNRDKMVFELLTTELLQLKKHSKLKFDAQITVFLQIILLLYTF